MSESNLDDLIIADNEPESSGSAKSKSIVVLLALIVLLIIVGAVLAKMIFSSSTRDINGTKSQIAVNNTRKEPALNSDSTTYKSKSNESENDDLDKDMQVQDSELAPLNDSSSPKDVNTVSLDDENKKDDKANNNSNNTSSAESNTKESSPKTEMKREEIVIDEREGHKASNAQVAHTKPKVHHKPHPKPKHRKAAHSYGGSGNVYIQVGSFTKGPTESFIDKIRRAGFKYRIKPIKGYRRVYVGPFRSREEAKQYLGKVRSQISANAFIK